MEKRFVKYLSAAILFAGLANVSSAWNYVGTQPTEGEVLARQYCIPQVGYYDVKGRKFPAILVGKNQILVSAVDPKTNLPGAKMTAYFKGGSNFVHQGGSVPVDVNTIKSINFGMEKGVNLPYNTAVFSLITLKSEVPITPVFIPSGAEAKKLELDGVNVAGASLGMIMDKDGSQGKPHYASFKLKQVSADLAYINCIETAGLQYTGKFVDKRQDKTESGDGGSFLVNPGKDNDLPHRLIGMVITGKDINIIGVSARWVIDKINEKGN